ncbi:alpha/beta hydrolase [Gilvimarinus sp. SDUM040013]|uniref:Alpha/beta hydrolase n=1 Tax=Gilvimarinus gilvus TaxID=3058038 RepID=A0ABU4RVS5_9GAMM|nr:alpha/beta hydrolase [Gilvimarinus sp. SDUM040013]MDO3388228.1 alpha/beta hydrolase [Gilvimarinus sp. SDUM040013]MDX6847778.1 alpha/beta hydrolase [Gilvimarinus sp. SDUM040013]
MRLVLLPGMDGTGDLFAPLLAELPQKYCTEVVSLNSLSAESYDGQVRLLVEKLWNNEPKVLVAESYSGPLALQLCQQLPNCVTAVIFIASFTGPPSPYSKHSHKIPLGLMSSGPVSRVVLNYLGFDRKATQDQLSRVFQSVEKTGMPKMRQRLRNISRLTNLNVSVNVPALYIRPKNDRFVSLDTVRQVATTFSSTEVVELQRGHFIGQHSAKECAGQIDRFLLEIID